MVTGGSGTQVLSGTNITYSGSTTINQGSTLVIQDDASAGTCKFASSSVADNGAFDIRVSSSTLNFTFPSTCIISGTGSVTRDGTGTSVIVSMGGANTYSGSTYVTSGIIQYVGNPVSSGGTITSSPIGAGTLVLNGGTFAGDATNRNILNPVTVSADSGLGLANTAVQQHFQAAVTLSGSHALTFGSNMGSSSVIEFAGGIGESVSTPGSSLSMTVSPGSGFGVITLSGSNTYTGGTSLTNGKYVLSSSGQAIPGSRLDIHDTSTSGDSTTITTNSSDQFSHSAVVTFYKDGSNPMYLNLANQGTTTGTTQTIGGLASTGVGTGVPYVWLTNASSGSFNSNGTLTINPTSGQTYSYSGVLADNYASWFSPGSTADGTGKLNLTINGTGGTQTLGGTNIKYTGTTTITAGTLLLGSANVLPASSPMVLGGGTFSTGGFSQTMTSTLTLQDNSVIDLGVNSNASTLIFADSSGVTWTAGKTLTVDDWHGVLTIGGGAEELKFGSSNTALTSSQLGEIQFYDPAGLPAGTYGAKILSTGEVVPIPEPGTLVLLAIGLIGLLAYAWRRRK